jgi:hypothetical protein
MDVESAVHVLTHLNMSALGTLALAFQSHEILDKEWKCSSHSERLRKWKNECASSFVKIYEKLGQKHAK